MPGIVPIQEKIMAGMIMCVELAKNGFAELEGRNIKYWAGEGLPVFEGGLEGFATAYPQVMQELVDCNAVRKADDTAE